MTVLRLDDLLTRVLDLGGSDLHLTVGVEPSVRVQGELKRLTEFPALTGAETKRLIHGILTLHDLIRSGQILRRPGEGARIQIEEPVSRPA